MAWLLVLIPAVIIGGICFLWREDKVGLISAAVIPSVLTLVIFAVLVNTADVNSGWSLATIIGWFFISAIGGGGGLAGFYIGETITDSGE